MKKKNCYLSAYQAAMKHGYKSGLEDMIAEQLKKAGVDVKYETETILYIIPESLHKYRPDFILPNGIIIESKGRFLLADRKKHLLVKEQHPDLDIRFVFTNSRAKITKTSKTSYAMWCTQHGFKYADKLIPTEWLNENR